MRRIKHYLWIACWLASAFQPGSIRAQEIIDGIMAVVDNEPILRSEVSTRASLVAREWGINPETEPDGFADDFSWGYRMIARFDYYNAIGAVTVSPRIAWAHDVDGTTPGPGGSFIDGRKTLTLGVGFNYLDRWIFDLAYTDYMGGGRYNLLQNRDFFTASVRYSF